MAEVKFCGLTRAEDAAVAASLGAEYIGVIFAGGPRLLDAPRARVVLAAAAGSAARRVGVFGAQPVAEILRVADAVALDVIQLHDGGTAGVPLSLRTGFGGAIWRVIGVSGNTLSPLAEALSDGADALVLDTAVGGRSGGTGVAFDWSAVAPEVAALRARHRIVLAGGLRPGNVSEAVRVLSPDIVDVSSGVESSPGVKDPGMMRAFASAARLIEER